MCDHYEKYRCSPRKFRGGGRLSEWLRRRYATRGENHQFFDFDGGLKMHVNFEGHIGGQIFWHGCYSSRILSLARRLLKPSNVVLDIGANIGEFSVLLPRSASKIDMCIHSSPCRDSPELRDRIFMRMRS